MNTTRRLTGSVAAAGDVPSAPLCSGSSPSGVGSGCPSSGGGGTAGRTRTPPADRKSGGQAREPITRRQCEPSHINKLWNHLSLSQTHIDDITAPEAASQKCPVLSLDTQTGYGGTDWEVLDPVQTFITRRRRVCETSSELHTKGRRVEEGRGQHKVCEDGGVSDRTGERRAPLPPGCAQGRPPRPERPTYGGPIRPQLGRLLTSSRVETVPSSVGGGWSTHGGVRLNSRIVSY